LLVGLAGCCAVIACSSQQPVKAKPEPASLAPKACSVDEVREYRCESLLPWTSALPAPEPYSACPSSMDVSDPEFPPPTRVARFDSQRTDWVRKRSPQQCCYSWCGKLGMVEADEVVDSCQQPLAFPESACVPELESGTRGELAAEPYDRCALAIRPPGSRAFSVPEKGALFSPSLTAAKRREGEPLCCYGWCSIAPPGTGLERLR
jgi:hypothetical protein